ncbi:MAG: sigma-54-dependent Fis family transcriptional regulator [Verrucomicrobia bacterium]|nr:sigma-54-dependent Fis family transcriptional regulator [Verrucomicrobiota bacterium]MBV8278137.1 sigma-54-dependent Fis family transcriptional regulator [Verrucomicrobiota bacterium]
MLGTILIVDDEKHTREGLRQSLEEEFDVYTASNSDEALNVLDADRIDLVLTDLRLGGEDGMALIEKVLQRARPPICILMTAYGSIATAVEAMRKGAYDFVTKPINLDELGMKIRRAINGQRLEQENQQLKQQVEQRFGLENLIGESPAMHRILDTIRQVAPTRATVLILGESGTGKELIARAIHNLSNRNKTRFVAFNCSAFSPQLVESELFGHEKGAFTGASERRIGRIEQAAGGTLFLDEIGEIDGNVQVKLLRALDPGVFERVGGNQTIKTDIRLIAATNQDLARLVSEKKFREDLYYRLNVVQIRVPPLRERKEDIPLLANAFLKEISQRDNKTFRPLSPEAMDALLRYDWPGNIRELKGAIDSGVTLAIGPQVTLPDLPLTISEARFSASAGLDEKAGQMNLHNNEMRLILRALEETRGNRTEAAKKLGISRRTLHRRLKELNLTTSEDE